MLEEIAFKFKYLNKDLNISCENFGASSFNFPFSYLSDNIFLNANC